MKRFKELRDGDYLYIVDENSRKVVSRKIGRECRFIRTEQSLMKYRDISGNYFMLHSFLCEESAIFENDFSEIEKPRRDLYCFTSEKIAHEFLAISSTLSKIKREFDEMERVDKIASYVAKKLRNECYSDRIGLNGYISRYYNKKLFYKIKSHLHDICINVEEDFFDNGSDPIYSKKTLRIPNYKIVCEDDYVFIYREIDRS